MTNPAELIITPASDCSLIILFGEDDSLETQKKVFHYTHYLIDHPLNDILNIHPGYSSILISVNIAKRSIDSVQKELRNICINAEKIDLPESKLIKIPVLYGGEKGADIALVADFNDISIIDVIDLHSSGDYYVSFIGFTPGFPYISGLNPKLETPRLKTPRKHVPLGSVAIGGKQTGIYPSPSPGGWNLIGQTPLKIFDVNYPENALIKIGDRIEFYSINESEFERLQLS